MQRVQPAFQAPPHPQNREARPPLAGRVNTLVSTLLEKFPTILGFSGLACILGGGALLVASLWNTAPAHIANQIFASNDGTLGITLLFGGWVMNVAALTLRNYRDPHPHTPPPMLEEVALEDILADQEEGI